MMHLFWVVLWAVHHHLAHSSGPDHCNVHQSSDSHKVSPLLESLQCHNDYQSYIYCKWRGHRNTTLQLWLQTNNERKLCVPYNPPAQDGTVQCRINTETFSIDVVHTVFFLKNETQAICSSPLPKPVGPFQCLRARPPVDLSTHNAGGGDRWISWSSPYPSSSSLNKNLTYQLSYRTHGHDNWTSKNVSKTRMKLEKQLLLPGHRYEAKVRARASVGKWSAWSPVVTWQTEKDAGQLPILHCVLDGETEVTCSWEVSRELVHFITYQLACRHYQTAQSEICCENPTVGSDLQGTVLRYSCSLSVADPAHLLLELLPTHNTKTFIALKNIHPKPPEQVKVKKKDTSWMVEWTKPHMKINLYYQICYYMNQDQEQSDTCVNTTNLYLTIPGVSLIPSQEYQVKVRSLVLPGFGTTFEGVPSEWTEPKKWTSYPATWSLTSFLYFLISVFVAVVFLIFYCTFPSCQRRVIMWVDSVPSPGKSKILSEIKSATSRSLMQSEDTSICKVLHFDSVSTCSSDLSLWLIKDTDKTCLEPDEGFWNGDQLPTLSEKVNSSDTSSMSFSGPYIFCQTSHPIQKSLDAQSEEEVKEEKTSSNDSLSPGNFALYGGGYVSLPSRTKSRSTQDLVSHSNVNKDAQMYGSAEQDQQCPGTTPWTGKVSVQPNLSEPTSRDQPPAYNPEPLSPWPQGGQIQASGYCFLPQPK